MSRARDFADLAGSADAGGLTGRNMLINGAFNVAQRGTSATVTTGSAPLTVDRFSTTIANLDQASLTESQDSTVPSGQGFANSFKVVVGGTAETALDADEQVYIRYQGIEGQDAQHLAFGTSSAKKTTLSFWVRSGVTGNYAVLMYTNNGIGGSSTRSQTLTYTVNAADTWEYKTITFDGDGASGNALADNTTAELQLYFSLAAGSNSTSSDGTSWGNYAQGKFAFGQTANLIGTANAAYYITGVQLEVGETATPFEHEDYGTTLAKCQRYLKLGGAGVYGIYNSAANIEISIPFSPNMRAAPTLSMAKTTVTISNKTNSNTADATSVSATNISASPSGAFFAQIGNCNVTSASAGHIAQFRTDEFLQLDAEL